MVWMLFSTFIWHILYGTLLYYRVLSFSYVFEGSDMALHLLFGCLTIIELYAE